MTELTGNAFASAVRRVAAAAPAVRAGTARAGAACAVALAILAAPYLSTKMPAVLEGPGIPGSATVAAQASKNVEAAKVQAKVFAYYACGLLRTTRADIAGFEAGAGVSRIRAIAAETLRDGATQPRPAGGLALAAANMSDLAGTMAMVGLSKVVDVAARSPGSDAWASSWTGEYRGVSERVAERSRIAGERRDLAVLDAATREVDAAYEEIGCAAGPRI